MKARHRQGFTLIELLVVIAIVAVLAAILFPVFIAAKENGKKTTCVTHLREIGSALLAYIGDWNNTFPRQQIIDNYFGPGPVGGSNPEDLLPDNVKVLLWPYVKNRKVWECPAWTAKYRKILAWSSSSPYGLMGWGGYPYCAWDDVLPWDPIGLEGRPYSFITRPTKKCAMWDRFWGDFVPHLGGTVLLYVDGHVRWHKVRQGTWPEGYEYIKP